MKRSGKVANLEDAIKGCGLDMKYEMAQHVGIAHTRWATHGPPTEVNCHPHTSAGMWFSVVHNGIITNFKELRTYLEGKGKNFVSETDTEAIAQLIQHVYDLKSAESDDFSLYVCIPPPSPYLIPFRRHVVHYKVFCYANSFFVALSKHPLSFVCVLVGCTKLRVCALCRCCSLPHMFPDQELTGDPLVAQN